jgi:hypothetical protein
MKLVNNFKDVFYFLKDLSRDGPFLSNENVEMNSVMSGG